MSDVSELEARIEGAFSAARGKVQQQQQRELQLFQERQRRLGEYEKVLPQILAVAKPRLEALARRAGDRATVTPTVTETRRSARFEFRSPKAYITLTFSVAPDREIRNAVVESDLRIVPVLWRFDSHAEFSTPVAGPDVSGVAKWLDDRIVEFVELYVQIHEGEFFEQADFVEDPVAKVKFPKFAAGASLEHGGQTHYFIDENSKGEFARQKGIAGK